jgi:DNA-binding CsgD family transcriptional regulator
MTISAPVGRSAPVSSRVRTLAGRIDDAVARGADSPARLSQALLAEVLDEIPSAGGSLLLMHPHTGLFWTGAVTDLPAASCHPFFTVEVEAATGHSFRRLSSTGAGARGLCLRADRPEPLATQVLEPFGFSDEIRVVCRDASLCWAGLSLWRTSGRYDAEDEEVLDAVADLLGRALRGSVLVSLEGSGPAPGRGVLVVEDGALLEASSEGIDFLRELADPGFEDYRHVEHLLALARANPRFSALLATEDGRWLSAHGTELGPGRVAIALAPATPADLFGTRVAGAALSAREVEVTRLLCRGLSDAEIARDLGVSTHTARDHVKAVRRKLGVRSRTEVAALVFADRYLDEFLDTAAVSHVDVRG